jgi:hypothetical protein
MATPVKDCWVENETTVRARDWEGYTYTYTAHKMENYEEAWRFAGHIRAHGQVYSGSGINLSFWRKD